MAKFGFLSVLEEEMDKHFTFDYAIDWNKKNHAVEVTFILEAQNQAAVETVDDQGEVSSEDIVFEDYVLFYNQAKSKLTMMTTWWLFSFWCEKGFSREFLAYFAETLNDVATKGLDDLMDFLADENATDFALEWDAESFEKGKAELTETEFFAYPRY